ncbi:MAG: NADH-quinone oxidoreductase [Sulfurovum sp. FS08-3]|jgi:NADH-quinone oxidoreductase subunit A|nr:MAG: NADH-quinone oxidoreductase [Sulfurovum sp. FS08-3]
MTTHLALASSVIFVIVLALPILFHLTRYVGARSDNERKNEPYESGVGLTHTESFDTFNIKFYVVGIVFLLFDVEVLFLFPWAINLRDLGLFGMVEMFVFIGILVAGLIYVYRSNILKWA